MTHHQNMKFLTQQVSHKSFILFVIALETGSEALGLFYVRILGRILDVITIQKNFQQFVWLSFLYIAVFLAEKIFFMLSVKLKVKIEEQVTLHVFWPFGKEGSIRMAMCG